jgi:hypothetical protein
VSPPPPVVVPAPRPFTKPPLRPFSVPPRPFVGPPPLRFAGPPPGWGRPPPWRGISPAAPVARTLWEEGQGGAREGDGFVGRHGREMDLWGG